MNNVTPLPNPGPRPIGAVTQNVLAPLLKLHAMGKVYCDLLAAQIRRSLLEGDKIPEADGLSVDQHQSNGLFCVHQLRVTLPGKMGTYRVIIAPPDAPIFIGTVPVDEHFCEPLVATK